MAGRAFEAYVIDKLQSQEKSNDYLANIVSKEYWDAQEALMRMDFTNTDQPGADSTYPYPTESEMPAISKAFDQFFATIKHEETANGNVRLFEPKAGYNESPQQWDESYGVQEAEGGNPDGEQQAARAFDVDAPSAIPGAPEVSLIQVGKQKAPRVIRSASEAASATRYLSQFAQERLVALVTDAKGVPLAIIHHTTGKTNSAQVEFGVLAGAITSIDGAANVWISHNHPSGEAALSDSDRAVFDRIKDLMDGSGVTAQGILAVTPKIFSADGAQKADNWYIKDLPARGKTIEVVERAFVVQPKARLGVTSPSAAMRMISAYSAGKTGVLLMDTQHKPTAFIPLTGEQMGKLRDGSLGDVLRAIHKTGAK